MIVTLRRRITRSHTRNRMQTPKIKYQSSVRSAVEDVHSRVHPAESTPIASSSRFQKCRLPQQNAVHWFCSIWRPGCQNLQEHPSFCESRGDSAHEGWGTQREAGEVRILCAERRLNTSFVVVRTLDLETNYNSRNCLTISKRQLSGYNQV
jgi:hypothetical protein